MRRNDPSLAAAELALHVEKAAKSTGDIRVDFPYGNFDFFLCGGHLYWPLSTRVKADLVWATLMILTAGASTQAAAASLAPPC